MIVLEDDKIKDLLGLKTVTQYRIYLMICNGLMLNLQKISSDLKISDKKVEESCKLLIEKSLLARYRSSKGEIVFILKSDFDIDNKCENCDCAAKFSIEETYGIECTDSYKCVYSNLRKLRNIKRLILKKGAVKCDYESIIKGRFGISDKSTSEWNEKDFIRFLMKQYKNRNNGEILDRKEATITMRECIAVFRGKCEDKWRFILKAFIIDRITDKIKFYAIYDLRKFNCMIAFIKKNYPKFRLALFCPKNEINCVYSLKNKCAIEGKCGKELIDYMTEKYN